MSHSIVTVNLGHRSYDILIGSGLLERAGEHLKLHLNRPHVSIITDETVAELHLDTLISALGDSGITAQVWVLPAGEQTKSFDQFQALVGDLLEAGLDRSDTLVAFGGGVIGDLTGFVASVLKRGCRFVQIPTTLLAQVDSSVGGKTAINVPQGKNLVGAFYQPQLVLADTSVLGTLPERQLKAGYAEVVKYGLLGDADFFEWLDANSKDVLTKDGPARAEAIARSCQAKADIVAEDEREKGQRALLNLGHTFGHALEALNGYSDTLLHGEAVAAGMGLAFDYAVAEKLCPKLDAERAKAHLRGLGLYSGLADMGHILKPDPDAMLAAMKQDKKNAGDAITLVLPRSIGSSFVAKDQAPETVLSFLKKVCV